MLDFAQIAVWYLLPLLIADILRRMWMRRDYRDYPLFFVYMLEQLIRFAILFYFYQHHLRDSYDHAYAVLTTIEAILQIGIVCELFADVFRPYEKVRHIGPRLLRWTSVLFLLGAIFVAAYSTGADSYKFLNTLFAMERSVEIVQGGFLLLLALSSSLLAFQWKPQALWIALGFGLFTSVNLLAYTLRSEWGMASQSTLSLISNIAYDCSALLWVRAFCAHPQLTADVNQQFSNWDVQSWNKALLQLLRR